MKILSYLRNLKGKTVTVETKQKSEHTGVLAKIDKQMNITLKSKAKDKNIVHLIRGTNVRYVIINDWTDCINKSQ